MKRIWFRVGMEAEITEDELEILKSGDWKNKTELMRKIIEKAELSGETYVPMNWGDDRYDNPDDDEICVEF